MPVRSPRRRPKAVVSAALPFLRPAVLSRSLGEGPGPLRISGRDAVYRRLLATADVCAAALATVGCMVAFGNRDFEPGLLLGAPAVLLISKLIGLYDRDEVVLSKSTLEELPTLFQLAGFYTLLLWLIGGEAATGRPEIFGLWAAMFVSTAVARGVARQISRRITAPERCLLIGREATRRWLEEKLDAVPHFNAELVGSIRIDGAHGMPPIDEIRRNLRDEQVDRVILALHDEVDADAMLELITYIKGSGCKVSLMPRMLEVIGSSVEFDNLDGAPILGVRRFGLSRSSLAVKRSLDIGLSLVLLIAVAPVALLIALLIRLDSPGGALFRQTRIGRDGKPFQMLKFRSMVCDAEAQRQHILHLNETRGLFKIARDPRVTRVGRLLRNTSLDELPQLINVLWGQMSLVGPRPLIDEDDRRIQGWHRRRLHLKPGMTGPWQILGSARIPLEEMVTIDYLYVANWTLWSDIRILLQTIGHVVGRRGC